MLNNLTGWHLLIVLAIVLLLFGAPKLPGLAKSVGQSMRIFRSEVKTMKDENADDAAPAESEMDEGPAPNKPATVSKAVGPVGLEPTTSGLKVRRSTD